MHSFMDDPMVLESRLSYPKALDKNALVARAMEVQEVLLQETGVHETVVGAASCDMGVTERDGMEVAPFDASQCTELDTTTDHGDGANSQYAQDQGPTCPTKQDSKGSLVVEQRHEVSGNSNSPMKSPAGGSEGGAKGTAVGQKKRKRRSENWTDEETEILLKAVSERKNRKSRLDKSSGGNEPWWEVIATEVPGRTGNQCRMRMDTLTKSYRAIEEYCDNQNKEFRQLKEEGFGDMKLAKLKLATRFTESWYNQMRDYCPPRVYEKTRKQGVAGSLLENEADFISSAASTCGERGLLGVEFHNANAESTKMVKTAPGRVTQSTPLLEAFEVVVEEPTRSWACCMILTQLWTQLWTRSLTTSNEMLRKCRKCGSN